MRSRKRAVFFSILGLGLLAYFFLGGTFRFVFLLVYLLPHVYLYTRMKKAFAPGRSRNIFTGIFMLVVLLFPVSMLGDDSGTSAVESYMRLGGYYYLPVLLYGLLLYLFFDALRLINRLARFCPPAAWNHRKFRAGVLVSILLITFAITGVGIYQFSHTRLHPYHIEIPRRSGQMEEVTIAMAADLHLSDITRPDFLDQFVRKMNASQADVILLVGDIVESGQETPNLRTFEEKLRKMKAPYGVYAVEGNHEHYGREDGFDFFRKTGIKLLKDTVVVIGEGFALLGRNDRHVRDRAPLGQLLSQAPDSLPRVVMDHQPFELEKAAQYDIDLQFSGHTHHGQLWPLNYITEAIYRISWGHEKIHNTHFFVTCGAQGWGPPVKTSSFSEIMVVEVEFVEKD